MSVEQEWLSVADVSAVFGISKWTIYDLVEQGRVPHGRFGRRLTFNKAELEAWVRGEIPVPCQEPEPEPNLIEAAPAPRSTKGPKPKRRVPGMSG